MTNLGELMLYGKDNKELYINNVLITELVIPSSVQRIYSYAFYGCKQLTSVKFESQNFVSIGDRAFYDCSEITDISLPNYCQYINNYAFYGCSKIASIKFPLDLREIGNYAFYGCSGIIDITIWNELESIGNYAFYGCSKIAKLSLPGSLKRIGIYAFSGCNNLTEVTFWNYQGWQASTDNIYFSNLSSSMLENKKTAATYLTKTYCSYYWKRI